MFHKLVGFKTFSEDDYRQYREELSALLLAHQGVVRYEFDVNRTLSGPTDAAISKVFILSFPDRSRSERFTLDARYKDLCNHYALSFPEPVPAQQSYLH